jgi:ABC-2 type transport system permease protein
MIGTIARKEIIEYRRDGRVRAIAALIALLCVGGLITGWSTHTEQQRQARQAQREDQSTFIAQGEKPHHSAAHFGRMAYKPVPPLAVFDPGSAPYLGQVIWLEAHRRDPAMFRPAEDSPELRRLADLSVAGVLTLLLPLLTFLIGYGTFAAERERGTLRLAVSSGADLRKLFIGKLIAVAGIPIGVSFIALLTSLTFAVIAPENVPTADLAIRGAALLLGYGLYSVSLAGIALLVSATARTATSALLVLLSLWAVSIVIMPRVAASVALHFHPTPESGTFWTQTSEAIGKARPARNSEEYRALENLVLSRAIGREVTAEQAKEVKLDRRGLSLEISEVLGARGYAAAYDALFAAYDAQHRARRLFSILSPAISLQHFSSGVSGTDVRAHRHFSEEAERQRNLIIRKMNEDMMLNGSSGGDPGLASTDFWQTVPDFRYLHPSAGFTVRGAAGDFFVILGWSVLSLAFSWWRVRQLKVV